MLGTVTATGINTYAEKGVMHERYNPLNLENDIGIIFFDTKVSPSK